MATRRGKAAETDNNNTTEENPVTTETPEAEASTTEPTATEATASTTTETKADDKPVDLTAFNSAVQAAYATADTATGEITDEELEKVTAAYRALEGIKAKNAAKAAVNEQMKEAMNSGSLAGARAYLNISEKALVAAAGGSKSSTPADPTENFVQRIATLTLGYQLAVANVPEGVGDNWQEQVDKMLSDLGTTGTDYFAWTQADPESRGDEPDVTSVVRNAAKLAQGKTAKAGVSRGGGTFTGERRDIGEHIKSAFEGVDEGTFLTIAQIRSHKSEEYGDTPPSAGAISARLFPKSGESSMAKFGINPDTQDGKKGAVKVAVAE